MNSNTDRKDIKHNFTVRTQKRRGQAVVVVALASIVLIAAVGLAVDGGSMYVQRRNAQNASDAMALAATRVMLDLYDVMILSNASDVDGDAADEQELLTVITEYANEHNIAMPANVQAFYVDYNKQLVSNTQVGSYGGIPWSRGAKGITVKAKSETTSFFMNVVGWNKIGATASSTAFMGIAEIADIDNIPLMPFMYYTSTTAAPNLVPGNGYLIAGKDVDYGQSNENGWIDFNGQGGSAVAVDTWLECGFNPQVTASNWATFCPSSPSSTNLAGPTKHWDCANTPCTTAGSVQNVPYFRVGEASEGWYINGNSGNTQSSCGAFQAVITSKGGGAYFYIPIMDYLSSGKYHLRAIGKFWIDSADVDCHSHWEINGTFEEYIYNYSGGQQGDLRSTTGHMVYLDN